MGEISERENSTFVLNEMGWMTTLDK